MQRQTVPVTIIIRTQLIYRTTVIDCEMFYKNQPKKGKLSPDEAGGEGGCEMTNSENCRRFLKFLRF